MRVLLDTHCWLWLQTAPRRFSDEASAILADRRHELLLSAASSWEIAIKWALGRLSLPVPPAEYVPDRMQRSGVVGLAVEHHHVLAVAALAVHHTDPFDRLLVAQAVAEGATLLTADHELRPYEVDIIWARR